jgi:hypothetical protein
MYCTEGIQQQVIINEGRVRNSELLEYYGFVLTKGADNYIEVSSLSEDAEGYIDANCMLRCRWAWILQINCMATRRRCSTKPASQSTLCVYCMQCVTGYHSNHIFKLRGTEIPRDLLFALRVYHATVYDWEFVDNAFNDKMISYQNELKVAQTIIELCEDSLQQYETTGKVPVPVPVECNYSAGRQSTVRNG